MEEKKLGVFQKAQVKRLALGLKPLMRRMKTVDSQAEKLREERELLELQVDSIKRSAFLFVGDTCLEGEVVSIIEEVVAGKKGEADGKKEEEATIATDYDPQSEAGDEEAAREEEDLPFSDRDAEEYCRG